MKIIILGPAHPYRGGIAALNERLAAELQQEGHTVKIVTFTLQYPKFLFPGKSQYVESAPPSNLVIRRKINSINPLNWVITGKQLQKEKPDLVIARFWIPFMGPSLGTICHLIRKNRYSKIIALTDNIIPHEKKPGDRLLTGWFLKNCHGVVVMSKSVLEDLKTFDAHKPGRFGPHPIYNHYGMIIPLKEALNRLHLDPSFHYLLFFGLIRDYKGLDLLIEAMSNPILANLKIKLLVAGEFYSEEEKYRDLVIKMNQQDRIVFYPRYIPDEEVKYFFSSVDMVVQPYREATQSGVTQVAYHFEKPMLVTDVGGLAEIVPHGEAGYVVRPQPLKIAEAICDFYTNERKDFFEKGVKKEKVRFAWSNFIRLFYELSEEIGK